MQDGFKKKAGSKDGVKRIFIALKVDPDENIVNMMSSLSARFHREGIRLINIDNIHITLAFLGNTEEEMVKRVISILDTICNNFVRFDLSLKGIGVFKNIDNPRVLWIGIESSDELMALNRNLVKGLREAEFDLEDRAFNPHLTLCRIKYINDKQAFIGFLGNYQNLFFQKVPVDEVVLYESILLQSGPVYNPVARFRLIPD
jgi:RNA 2',3'-cyclic 3'-phosphodiesterase